ncbi:TetR/AcrR family transcriptional regulator [Agrococcus sp. ARC_14]|uniref:TetR/AcrR family transcriptional regulator n=1 Tax=Agrococcus sp. ARC_14 TaxID=2919927 RepID=UPI001F065F1D|nr:TetR/AcrR family transcriptional regulator [Agrococcus sp. ARC_14]MCH1883896.1 TetR/AcrR family transcriptional regulator [Agrococcus sp. ARC_14]
MANRHAAAIVASGAASDTARPDSHEAEPETAPALDASAHRILDAAAELLATRGTRGVTVAEIARTASVSRPTVYRRWPDADAIVRAAQLRAVTQIIDDLGAAPTTRDEIVRDVLRFSASFRSHPVFARLLEHEPESFSRYALQRIGASQRVLLHWVAAAITTAQQGGSVRRGSPSDIAVMLLLIAQAAILSHGIVTSLIDEQQWQAELRHALEGHLSP